ncbi:MAG: hypothetical protein OES20_10515 [Gammaproteobacteria bacterium]|nr:hypothetical protein [Gammaproteobacteria bacterium]MDH3858038.1 hypothetical protein [Gammaproteobacteria bacterium]
MCKFILRIISLLLVIGIAGNVAAVSESECNDAIKDIDARIESGKYSDQKVNIAKQMRDSVLQSCGFLDTATLEKMMEGFEQLLPTRSAEEQEAVAAQKKKDREALREKQREELEAKRAERAKLEKNRVPEKVMPIPAVLQKPPTGSTLKGLYVARDEDMYRAEIQDFDKYKDKARILYVTRPSPQQYGREDARVRIYVIEADKAGSVVQHLVAVLPKERMIVGRLSPASNELVVENRHNKGDNDSVLQTWSVSDRKLKNSADLPKLPWVASRTPGENDLRITTGAGHLLYFSSILSSSPESGTAWATISTDGDLVKNGEIHSEGDIIYPQSWFRTSDGGTGLVMLVRRKSGEAIKTNFIAEEYSINGVTLTPGVNFEKRIMHLGRDGAVSEAFTGLDRSFIWSGIEKLSKTENARAAMQEFADHQRLHGIEHGNETRVEKSNSFAGRNMDVIKSVGDGYGVLVKNNSGKRLSEVSGYSFDEYRSGKRNRSTYLHPAAEHLKVLFETFDAPNAKSVYLLGRSPSENRPSYIVRLDSDRELDAYVQLQMDIKVFTGGMLADEVGAWVFGYSIIDNLKQEIWVERVEF